jgi:hypothetical protein
VGIDGSSDLTVEQIGTEQDVVNGTPVYQAWWEMYSSGIGQPVQPIRITIEPGDSITASVQYIASGTYMGDFHFSIVDNTRSESFSTYESSSATQSPLAQRTSAEWIVEAPTVGSSVADLANFGSVTFTNATAVINGVLGPIDSSSWQSEAINMVSSNGVAYDTTSVLTNSGTSFVATYDSTAGAAVQKHNESASRPDFRAAHGGTPSSGVKIHSPSLGGHSGLWSSCALIRQLKQSTAGFSIDHPYYPGSKEGHIPTRSASEGSGAFPSLARRVNMQQHAELPCRGNRIAKPVLGTRPPGIGPTSVTSAT